MKRKLYSNMKRMTSMFCLAMVCLTVTTLLLRLTVFSEMAVASAGREPEAVIQETESALFPYTLSRRVTMAAPQAKGDFGIVNPETNTDYMTVNYILPETGQNLLSTGFIRPGEMREALALHIQLPEGVYECVAQVTAYDPDTLQPRGSEEWDVTLSIGQKSR